MRLIRPSTRAFWRESRRVPGFRLFDWLHGYVYARWPYLYIGIGTGEHRIARLARPVLAAWGRLRRALPAARQPARAGERPRVKFEDTYHGKVVPLAQAVQLVQVKQNISLPNLEPIIPYARARDLIMMNPDHIAVLDCPCRVARENPCLPLDVCLLIGEPFASFVLEHHPQRSRRITAEEAVDILRAEDDRGHVHHAFFKDAMLGRFYAICNCCSCCCGAMQAQRSGTLMLTASGFSAQVDEALCAGCGQCEAVCQFHAIVVEEISRIQAAACMGCGVCISHCDNQAISLVRDPAKGEPLDLVKLMELA